jgi:hypothetical protein
VTLALTGTADAMTKPVPEPSIVSGVARMEPGELADFGIAGSRDRTG